MNSADAPVVRPFRMRGLIATLATDVRLQFRNGFYAAIAFMVAVYVLVISLLPELDWAPYLAPLLLGNLVVATFFFLAGQVLLEKEEGTLEAQIVTPLSVDQYLGSKVITLSALSLVENVAIAFLTVGWKVSLLPLCLGLILASSVYCLVGFIAVARYDSINQFLMPSMTFVTLLNLPILDSLGLWKTPLMWFLPLQPSLVLLGGSVEPLAAWQWLYGLLGSALWILLLALWCRRLFSRYVVGQAGARPR